MSNVLILGATGSVARDATDLFLNETDSRLTLYLRNARRLRNVDPSLARRRERNAEAQTRQQRT
jgi:saccharopine dehydrogenase-like NADP-dependent oxidoreductase